MDGAIPHIHARRLTPCFTRRNMTNEILLIISLVASFGGLLLFFRLFGKIGCFAWIAICTILANIEVTILVTAFGMEQTLGNVLFASSFLATDFLSEFYGKREANKAVAAGIATTCVFILFSFLWTQYNPSENDWAFEHVAALFSNTPRILIASLLAYAISEIIDVQLYHAWWKFTERKTGGERGYLWLRNNGSTLISQLVNIVIFNFGAFWSIYDFPTLLSITGACYVIYIFTSLLDTPFIYIARVMHESGKVAA